MSSLQEIQNEFAQRKHSIDKENQAKQLEKEAQKQKAAAYQGRKVTRKTYRGNIGEAEESKIEEPTEEAKREMDEYIRVVHKNTEMFSTYDPDTLLKILDECADKMGAEMEVYAGKFKARLKMATEMDNIELKVNILKVDDGKNCVEFNRIQGD